ncbi:isocitrate lyase/phosphoenolpyruvate mutase family protein [Streptomyces sp. NPDC088354]|uniref:isocitrate lyase/PEP mutase family protein n=1 Tax=Streptomyces sp. NPDC088354 TaxID=3365856 RepID=UPI00381A0703
MNPELKAEAELFRSLHVPGRPLLLANAWDAASARVAERAGAAAVATTSSGVSWTLGTADGGHVDPSLALALTARVAAAVAVPVSADIEGGYATGPEGVADTVRAVLAAGAVGVNIEDSFAGGPRPLRAPADQASRIAAARRAADEAGVPLFVHARTDTFLRGPGDIEETLARAAVYLDAGADGIFVPGVTDPALVSELADGIDAPLGVLAGPGAPAVAELAAAGAARVSLGSAVAEAAYALVDRATRELLESGSYAALAGGIPWGELNALMRPEA